jgi:ABC-type amino acid transport substrate-binding protein
MRIFKAVLFFVLTLVLSCCGCGGSRHGQFRIGVDPNWYPLNFDILQPYVNGFVDDLLLEISQYTGMEFIKVEANGDSLLDELREKKYEAVLTSLPSYNFYRAKYDFSHNFLDLGPVLVVPANSQYHDLQQMSNEVIGLVTEDPALLVLQKYPKIIVRKYTTVSEVLDAVVNGSVEAALIDRLVASTFVRDLYAGKLKIASAPLTDAGLHLICMKEHEKHLMDVFNKSIQHFSKKKRLQALQTKWQLD